jgi:hypothetical protein
MRLQFTSLYWWALEGPKRLSSSATICPTAGTMNASGVQTVLEDRGNAAARLKAQDGK